MSSVRFCANARFRCSSLSSSFLCLAALFFFIVIAISIVILDDTDVDVGTFCNFTPLSIHLIKRQQTLEMNARWICEFVIFLIKLPIILLTAHQGSNVHHSASNKKVKHKITNMTLIRNANEHKFYSQCPRMSIEHWICFTYIMVLLRTNVHDSQLTCASRFHSAVRIKIEDWNASHRLHRFAWKRPRQRW